MTNVFGLLPILLDSGVGSDVAKPIVAPMWGGLVSLSLLTLLVIPAVYVGLAKPIYRAMKNTAAGVPLRPSSSVPER